MSKFLDSLEVFQNSLICNYGCTTKIVITLQKAFFDKILLELDANKYLNFTHKMTKVPPFRRVISFESANFIIKRQENVRN